MRSTDRIRIPLAHGHWIGRLYRAQDERGLVIHPVRIPRPAAVAESLIACNLSCLLLAPRPSRVQDRGRCVTHMARVESLTTACEWVQEYLCKAGAIGLLAAGTDVMIGLEVAVGIPHVLQGLVCQDGQVHGDQSIFGDLIVPTLFLVSDERERLLAQHRKALPSMRLATIRMVTMSSDGAGSSGREAGGLHDEGLSWFLTHLIGSSSLSAEMFAPPMPWTDWLF